MARGYRRTITIDMDVSKVKKSTKDVNAAMRNLDSEFRKHSEELRRNGKESEKLTLKKDVLTKKIELQVKGVDALQQEYREIVEASGEYSKAALNKKKDLNNAETALIKMRGELEATTKELKNSESVMGRASESLQEFGQAAGIDIEQLASGFTYVGVALTGVATAAAVMSMNFRDSMARVNMVADLSVMSIEELERTVLDVSNTYGIAAGKIADAAYTMISSNLATEDLAQGLENAATMARIGFMDVDRAAKMLMQTTNIFNLSIDEQTQAVDRIAKAADASAFSITDLEGAFRRVAPAIRGTNVTMDDYLASVMALTDAGWEQRDQMQGLQSLFYSIAKPTKEATEIAEHLGFQWSASANAARTYEENLYILQRMLADTSVNSQELVKDQLALDTAMIITANGMEPLRESFDALNNSSGFAAYQFGYLDTAGERLRQALNRLKNTTMEGGGAFEGLINIAAGFLEILARMPSSTMTVVGVLGVLALALGKITAFTTKAKAAKAAMAIAQALTIQKTNAEAASNTRLAVSQTKAAAASSKFAMASKKLAFALMMKKKPILIIAAALALLATILALISGRGRETEQAIERATQTANTGMSNAQRTVNNSQQSSGGGGNVSTSRADAPRSSSGSGAGASTSSSGWSSSVGSNFGEQQQVAQQQRLDQQQRQLQQVQVRSEQHQRYLDEWTDLYRRVDSGQMQYFDALHQLGDRIDEYRAGGGQPIINNYSVNVDMDRVRDVNGLVQVFDDFTHQRIVNEGV